MKTTLLIGILCLAAFPAFAQVDVEHRRTILLQSSVGLNGEEHLGGFGFYWFNENNYPWTNTALRVIFAGVYLGGELSWFLPASTNTAIGVGGGGGLFVDSLQPYQRGERLGSSSFYGDSVEGHIFINQTIPNPTPLPLNLRASYGVSGSFYREKESTENFDLPDSFLTQTILAEFRFGGIEPGLTATRGAELYFAAEANYRSGFDGFGPIGSPYPAHSQYNRLLGSLAGKLPAGPVIVYARICGGAGDDVDQLGSWKIGGNLLNVDAWSFPLHGYYTREFLAEDFALANLELTLPVSRQHRVALHFYGDWAAVRQVPPADRDWHDLFGLGAGIGFRAPWEINAILSYGYGINAVRDGNRGGHEIAIALEKSF